MQLTVRDGQIVVEFFTHLDTRDYALKEKFRELHTKVRYNPNTGYSAGKYSPGVLLDIVDCLGHDAFDTDTETKALIESLLRQDKTREKIRAEFARRKRDKEIDLEGYRFDVPPMGAHQKLALSLFKTVPVLGLFADAGLGKTWILLHWLRYLRDHQVGPDLRALVIAPSATLVLAWVDDAAKFTPELKCLVCPSSIVKTVKTLEADVDSNIFLVNFEKLSRKEKSLERALLALELDVVIVDESKRISNPKSAMTEVAIMLGDTVTYRAVASAMPAPNSELEYWSQMRFLSPRVLGTSFSAHRKQYFTPSGFGGFTFTPNPLLDETRKKKIADYCVVFRSDDCLDLPPMLHHPLKVVLPTKVMNLYREYHEKQLIELQLEGSNSELWSSRNTLTRLMRLRELAGGFIMETENVFDETKNRLVPKKKIRRIHEEKALAVKALIENIPATEQVLIWAQFQEEFQILKEMIPGLAIANGATPKGLRDKQAKDFAEGNLRLLAAQPQSYKYGLTWVKCNHVVWYSLDWSLDSLYQANKRTHRYGQDKPVHYWYLLAYSIHNEPTIDQLILDRVQGKYANQEEMLRDFMKLSYALDAV